MIRKKTKKNTLLSKSIVIPGVIALFLLGVGLWALTNHPKKDSPPTNQTSSSSSNAINYGPATAQEKKEVQDNKINGTDTTASNNQISTDKITLNSSQAGPGSDVIIKTQLYGSDWKQCKLVFTQSSQQVTKLAGVIYQPEFSTCEGFAVPAQDFSSSGIWSITLTATKTSGESASAQGSLNIRK